MVNKPPDLFTIPDSDNLLGFPTVVAMMLSILLLKVCQALWNSLEPWPYPVILHSFNSGILGCEEWSSRNIGGKSIKEVTKVTRGSVSSV